MFDPQLPIENGMQAALIVVPVLFGLLATASVGLRVLSRRLAHRRLDTSDYIMYAALVITLGFSGLVASEPFTGAGMHLTDIITNYGMAPIVTYTKMTIANQVLWALAVCLPKLSILMLYSKVFTMSNFVLAARITAILIFMLGIATVLGAFLQCQPFAYNWDTTIVGGHCGDQVLSFKITGTLNVILDVIVLLLPMPHLYGLQLAMVKKVILMGTLALGFITCIFSALRIQAIASMDYSDITYLAGVPSIYSVLEPTLAITLACVPMMRPLLGGKYSQSGTRQGYSGGNSTTGNKTTNSGLAGSRGFQNLGGDTDNENDDSSEYQLRSVVHKHEIQLSTQQQGQREESVHSEEHLHTYERNGGIAVRTEWAVQVV